VIAAMVVDAKHNKQKKRRRMVWLSVVTKPAI
jgi:hypothetical protein